jgi:hypothetical protein
MKKTMLIAVLCISVLRCASSAMAWTMVYAHDGNGNATSGNISALVNAAMAGKQIRVMFTDYETKNIIDCPTVWVKGNTVYAQSTAIVGSAIDTTNGDKLIFLAPGYFGFYNVSTLGSTTLSRWRIGEHVSEGEDTYAFSLRWFVNY